MLELKRIRPIHNIWRNFRETFIEQKYLLSWFYRQNSKLRKWAEELKSEIWRSKEGKLTAQNVLRRREELQQVIFHVSLTWDPET